MIMVMRTSAIGIPRESNLNRRKRSSRGVVHQKFDFCRRRANDLRFVCVDMNGTVGIWEMIDIESPD
jgi:hypothetical protein